MKSLRIVPAFLFVFVPFLLKAQESIIVLDSNHSGATHDKVARNAIFLKPGFQFSATTNYSFWAHIDPNLPQPPVTAVDCVDPATLPPGIDQSLPVGTIPGFADVSATGAANYTIPIGVPPAAQGMQPNLSIVYNSQAGNGIMGMGWNLAGLSAIARVPKNIYNDGKVEEIKLDRTDQYAFDGNRLIWVSGSAHSYDGAVYHTEMETFVQVTAKGTSGNGPQWFEVKTKDGLTMEFGNTPGSRVTGANNTVIAWKINRIEDQFSNYMVFEYRTDDDEQPISTIKYTGNTTGGKEPYNTIHFGYATRNDVNTTWPAGKQITTDLLLESIEVISEGVFVRKYEFGYKCSYSSLLSTVALTGSDGERLNVTKIEWDNKNIYTEPFQNYTPVLTALHNYRCRFFPGDMNGDGISDILSVNYYIENDQEIFDEWKIYITNRYSYDLELKDQGTFISGTNQVIVEDTDQDGVANIFFNVFYNNSFGVLSEYELDASNNLQFKESTILAGENPYVKLADFDGNGVTDLMTVDQNNNLLTIIGVPTTYSTRPQISNPDNIYLIDFNGNGKTNIMFIKGDAIDCCKIFEYDPVNERFDLIYQSNFPSSNDKILFGDFNGDNKTDILSFNEVWNIYFSTGSGFFSSSNIPNFSLPLTNVDPFQSNLNNNFHVRDFNNDGFDDILESYYTINGSITNGYAKLHYNTGNAVFITKIKNYDGYVFTNYEQTYFGDFNGDGMLDIVWDHFIAKDTDPNPPHNDLPPILFYSKVNDLTQLTTTITNGLDQQTTFSYEKHKLKNFNTSDAFYKFIDQPVFIATGFSTEDRGIPVDQEFKFNSPFIHKQGKGFLGFSDVKINDNISGFTHKAKYQMETHVFNACIQMMQTSDDPPSPALFSTLYHPLQTQSVTLYPNNDTISKIIYNTSVNITDPCLYLDYELFYINPESKIEKDYLQNLTITTSYTYDNYGNPRVITVDYNGDAGTQTTNIYTSFGTWWCPKSRLQQSTVTKTRTGESNFTAATRYDYNTQGALITKKNFYTQPKEVTESYDIFDNFGNPQTVTVSANGLDSRQTLLEYDGYGRFVTKNTNPLGHETALSYDNKTGNLITQTDANGLMTRYDYDGFGRLEKITRPDGNTTAITRDWAVSGNQLYYAKEVTGGQPEKWNYFDALGRIQKAGHAGFSGDSIFVKSIYNSQGRMWKTSEPYSGTATQFTEYEYYTDNRLKKVTYPTGVTDTYSYTPNSTEKQVSSSNGMWKTTQTDGTGALIMAKDAGGQIGYTYYAHGGVKNIIYSGNSISMAYDAYGRQETLSDPDAGTVNYTWNAFGELTNQTDARNNSYDMFYDKLGRITEKKLGTTTVAGYTYDTAPGKGVGKMASIIGNNSISYTFEYDNLGRMIKRNENIEGESFNHIYTFDIGGRLEQTIYPSGFGIENIYQNGYLKEVIRTDDGTSIWKGEIFNVRNQPERYLNGNGLYTYLGYDDFGFPTTLQTSGIQNLEYEFNTQTGNLNRREDVAKTLQEDFTYDNLMKNRLETWQVGSGTIYSAGYNPNGNIENKTGLGAYDYQGLQPHAVSEVDNTGGIISPFEQNIDYTPFNKVESIMESLDGLQYSYGPDNQRKKAVVFYEHPQYTKYYSGNYEKKVGTTTQEFHYIFGGDGLTAVYITEDGTGNMYYIHKDHLGSVNCITDENGNLVEEMSFDAWGRRRNPADWTYNNVPVNYLIDRGFTGHEHLDEFDLINMNGRVYDPILGRFLSPDNYIQAPEYSQSLNRYSYCLNNPLVYTDPSGEFFWNWLAAMAGNYVIGGMDRWINKDMSFNDAFFNKNYITAGADITFSPSNLSFTNFQVTQHLIAKQTGILSQQLDETIAGFRKWNSSATSKFDDFFNDGIWTIGITGTLSAGIGGSFELGLTMDFREGGYFGVYTTLEGATGADISLGGILNYHKPIEGETISVLDLRKWSESSNGAVWIFDGTYGGNSLKEGLNPENLSDYHSLYHTYGFGVSGGLPLGFTVNKGYTWSSPTIKIW
jgi:RHS repeat-associated protein